MSDPKSLAAEIEAVLRKQWDKWGGTLVGRSAIPEIAAEIAALQSRAFDDGARTHVAEALKREAQEQAFRRDLAEQSYASLKDRFLRASHMAFAGNDRALRRLVSAIENPVPIQGPAALQPEGERSDA